MTQQVKPLRGRKARSPAPASAQAPATAAEPPPRLIPPPKPKVKAPPAAPLETGATAGIDKRTADRFKRGQLAIDAKLDLHGMRQDAAYAALARFLDRALAQQLRMLLIVTGKGDSREDGGVLRRLLPLWLDQGGHRSAILALTPARRQHGGDGAFYLLLKRRRE